MRVSRRAHGFAPARRAASGPPPREATDADVLLEEIAAIDIAFEEGLIGPDAYELVRAAAKERLVATMAEPPSS